MSLFIKRKLKIEMSSCNDYPSVRKRNSQLCSPVKNYLMWTIWEILTLYNQMGLTWKIWSWKCSASELKSHAMMAAFYDFSCSIRRNQTITKSWRSALTQHSPACSKVCDPAESRSSWARPRTPRTAHTPHARGRQWLWAGICLWSAGGIRHTLPSDPYLQWRGNPLIGTLFQSAGRSWNIGSFGGTK